MMARKSESGFTLIELLVALLVISIALVPFIAFMITGFNATNANDYRVEALNVMSTILETDTAIPYGSLGYYEDEFSTADSNYPSSTSPAGQIFNNLFGTDYLPGTTYPYETPAGYQTVDLGVASCQPSPCSTASSDLVQPYKVVSVGNLNVHIYQIVTWRADMTIQSGSNSCAYIDVEVYVYWSNFTQVAHRQTFVYPGGNNPNSNANPPPTSTCSAAASAASTPPPAPTSVTVSNTPGAAADTSLNVTWQQLLTSAQSPPGYYVIEWSTDPNFDSTGTTSAQTSPIEQLTATDINQQACASIPAGDASCYNYSYQIQGLAPSTTYYVEIWAYSQDGVGLTNSGPTNTIYITSGGPVVGSGGIQTAPQPPPPPPATSNPCLLSSLFTYTYPPSPGTPSGATPDLSYKFYLSQSGASQVSLLLGVNTANYCSSVLQGAYIGIGYYSSTGILSPGLWAPISLLSSGVYGFVINSTQLTSVSTGYYEIGLYDSNKNPLPAPPAPQLVSYLLLCPYIAIPERAQVSNKC
jgi:prepilin-type N-terminal cleavage/methylation domain-containing protein